MLKENTFRKEDKPLLVVACVFKALKLNNFKADETSLQVNLDLFACIMNFLAS